VPLRPREGSSTSAALPEKVQAILDNKELTLYRVSQQSAELYGRSSPYFLPHNLYYDLRAGSFRPSIHQIWALSRISGYRVADWLRVFGYNLEDITRLQVLLPSKRTIVLDTSLTDPNEWVPWLDNRPLGVSMPSIAPLPELLREAPARQIGFLQDPSPRHFLYAKVGREDAFAFPDLAPGSIVRVNPDIGDGAALRENSSISDRIFLVEHSKGFCCCRVRVLGELLIPMVAAMRRELISGPYIQADETPVDVQMHEGRGKNHQGYLWQYGRPGGTVVFDFRLGRGRDGPKQFLGQFEGILQTDGYAAYDQIGGPRMVHAACWAHARRQFFETVQLNPQDPVATPIVARMDELFAIDAEVRHRGLGLEARHVMRQEKAVPLLDVIRKQIEAARSIALPAGALAKACNYTLTLWQKLTRFLDYPELELSTNLAENSMRPVAIGRKNWIHVGSSQAGPKIAAILSVVESCRRLKLPVRDYLAAVLPGLADTPIQRLPELIPSARVGLR